MTNKPRLGKPFLPGSPKELGEVRYPKRPDGLSFTSAAGRVIGYLESNPNRFCSQEEILKQCKVYNKKQLHGVVSAIREAIAPDPTRSVWLIGTSKKGYMLCTAKQSNTPEFTNGQEQENLSV